MDTRWIVHKEMKIKIHKFSYFFSSEINEVDFKHLKERAFVIWLWMKLQNLY